MRLPAEWRVWLWLAVWAAIIAVAGMQIGQRMQVASDLRLFLPTPQSSAERILLAQLKEGPGTRMLLLALSGTDQDTLADVSDQLATELRSDKQFARVENGALQTDVPGTDRLAEYRYLLSADGVPLDTPRLQAALNARLGELSSPAGALAQDWLLRDPTGSMQSLLELWQGTHTPQLINGVWFDRAGQRALLLIETVAPGFDADAQHAALDRIHAAMNAITSTGNHDQIHLDITGPGAFTALLESSVRGDVTALGMAEGVASVVFLLLVLWSVRHVLLGSLTLATAGIGALLAVTLMFSSVHGITLAFGFTLLGVAMDYPVHLMLHVTPRQSVRDTLHHVWPTLRLSIATTCIAYLALALAGFSGLAQLGAFTVAGLLTTAVVIRHVLPSLISPAMARPIPAWVSRVQHAPRWVWLPTALIIVAAGWLLWSPRPVWNNELSGLTPVPASLQQLDTELRNELGAPDLRYLIAVTSDGPAHALMQAEALTPSLQSLVQSQVVSGFDSPAQWLPSSATQQQRQQALPSREAIEHALQSALVGLPFRTSAFDQFIQDVEHSRQLKPLTLDDMQQTPLAERLAATVFRTDQESVALITLSGVTDIKALQRWQQTAGDQVLLIDLKTLSEQLVERFREHALVALSLALVLIAVIMLRELPWRAALAVLIPVMATLLVEVAVLNFLGITLTLFHVVSLLLVGGLCFDYGLFFNRSEASDEESLRTRFAVMACWLSTTGSFALLTISSLPVLDAIGSTVALGVTLGFFIALLARHDDGSSTPTASPSP